MPDDPQPLSDTGKELAARPVQFHRTTTTA
jgi:hypothetical protein